MLLLSPAQLIQGLDEVLVHIKDYLQQHREMVTQRTGRLTCADHAHIPGFLAEAVHVLGTMRSTRHVIMMKYAEMTDCQILMIDDRVRLIGVQEVRLHLIIAWFQAQLIIREAEELAWLGRVCACWASRARQS